jgi:hypothetical protein
MLDAWVIRGWNFPCLGLTIIGMLHITSVISFTADNHVLHNALGSLAPVLHSMS